MKSDIATMIVVVLLIALVLGWQDVQAQDPEPTAQTYELVLTQEAKVVDRHNEKAMSPPPCMSIVGLVVLVVLKLRGAF